MTQQYGLSSMDAWLSSTGISHHSLLLHIPLIHLSAINNSLCPGIAAQFLNSSFQPLHLLGDLHPIPGHVRLQQWLSVILFRLPQISCFTCSLKCFSPDSDNCPDVGIRLLLQFPNLPRAGPALLTVRFFSLVPSSYRVFRGSIYSFLLVRIPVCNYWCSAYTSMS